MGGVLCSCPCSCPCSCSCFCSCSNAFDPPGPLPQRRSWQTRPRTGRRTRMCVVFRRYKDVSSKNPASGVDPRRAAAWARRQGVLSLGHLSLHKQRKVCSRAVGGRKPLILILIATAAAAKAIARARATTRAFSPLRGASYFSLLVQRKDNQKKAHPAYAPSALRAPGPLRCRDFSTRHPCLVEKRRTSMCAAPTGSYPSAPSLRKGPGKSKARATATAKIKAKARAKARAPLPNPPLAFGKGRELSGRRGVTQQTKQKRRHRIPSTRTPVDRTPQRRSAFQPVKALIRTSTTS